MEYDCDEEVYEINTTQISLKVTIERLSEMSLLAINIL